MSENPLVSVIVPIYKVENYLRECVNSIISQSYKNLEIILVDDGSPDKCPEICDEYALKDNRIKVIHKPNGGLSDARNAGIEIAKGEYLSFVDSDDVIHSQMIEVLMKPLIEDKGLKMSACTHTKNIESWNGKFGYVFQKMSAFDYMQVGFYMVAWGKIYHKTLFNGIEYPKGRLHEDEFTTYKLIYYSGYVGYIDLPFYYYRQREDSIMGQTKVSVKRMTDVIVAFWERMAFFENENAPKFLSKSVKTFSNYLINNEMIVRKRINEVIKQCSYKDLSFIERLKMKVKICFPFLSRIIKKLKSCLKFQS